MEEFKNLKRVAINELRKLDAAYANENEFREADIKKYDCLMHGLKCQLTAEAMMEAEEYEETGLSGRRGRGPDGRYVSRDSSEYMRGHSDGYDRGYSEAMARINNGATSGYHMPVPRYYEQMTR